MIVTMAGLSWSRGHTGLWNMIWDQGVIYFVTAVITNMVPAVLLMVDLNPIMNIVFSIPAITMTTTVSTRCFVRLSEYANRGDESASGILYVDIDASLFHCLTHFLGPPYTVPCLGRNTSPARPAHVHQARIMCTRFTLSQFNSPVK